MEARGLRENSQKMYRTEMREKVGDRATHFQFCLRGRPRQGDDDFRTALATAKTLFLMAKIREL